MSQFQQSNLRNKQLLTSLVNCAGTTGSLRSPMIDKPILGSTGSLSELTAAASSPILRNSVVRNSIVRNLVVRSPAPDSQQGLFADVVGRLASVRTANDYHFIAHDYPALTPALAAPLAQALLERSEALLAEGFPELAGLMAADGSKFAHSADHSPADPAPADLEARLLVCRATAALSIRPIDGEHWAEAGVFLDEACEVLKGRNPAPVVKALQHAVLIAQQVGQPEDVARFSATGQRVTAAAGSGYESELFFFSREKIDVHLQLRNWRPALREIGNLTQRLGGNLNVVAPIQAVALTARAARALLGMRRFDEASFMARKALRYGAPEGTKCLSLSHQVLGAIAVREGDFPEAADQYSKALAVERQQTQLDPASMVRQALALARVHASCWDRHSEERACYDAECDLRRVGLWEGGFGLEIEEYRARVAIRDGDVDLISERAQKTERHIRQISFDSRIAHAHKLLRVGNCFASSERPEDVSHAERLFEEAQVVLGDRLEVPELSLDILLSKVQVCAARGDRSSARAIVSQVHALARELGEGSGNFHADACLALAGLFLDADWKEEMEELLGRSRVLLKRHEDPLLTSWAEYYYVRGHAVLAFGDDPNLEQAQRADQYFSRALKYHRLARASGEDGLDAMRRADINNQRGAAAEVMWSATTSPEFLTRAIRCLRAEEQTLRSRHLDRSQRYHLTVNALLRLYGESTTARRDDWTDLVEFDRRWSALEAERSRRRNPEFDIDLE